MTWCSGAYGLAVVHESVKPRYKCRSPRTKHITISTLDQPCTLSETLHFLEHISCLLWSLCEFSFLYNFLGHKSPSSPPHHQRCQSYSRAFNRENSQMQNEEHSPYFRLYLHGYPSGPLSKPLSSSPISEMSASWVSSPTNTRTRNMFLPSCLW